MTWRMPHAMVLSIASIAIVCRPVDAADVFVRFRVLKPAADRYVVTTGGHRHGVKGQKGPEASWYLPSEKVEAAAGQWSRWIDLTGWPLHDRYNRSGGIAEWPSMKLTVTPLDAAGKPLSKDVAGGCRLEVELADKPDESAIVIRFVEESESMTIGFLLPHPLRQKKDEFETGSQMASRHRKWAVEATGGKPISLTKFAFCTSLWGPYDPGLARQEVQTLKMLGFNVIGGAPVRVLRDEKVMTYGHTWHYMPDPEKSAEQWQKYVDGQLSRILATEDGRWQHANMHHFVISDEIQTLDFRRTDQSRLNAWFRQYLRDRGVGDDAAEYPVEAMHQKTLPRDADLRTRKLMYHAAKFGHWWSARQLRQTSDLVRKTLPGMKTETLPSDHGFFNAWGPPHIGMSYRMLDLFELGAQQTVDYLAAEDWLGLNHMYGPASTWTGAQSFEYFSAILRCAIGDRDMTLMGLITPSDDGFLRLKAYSALAQGCKVFFFWTYGPTFISTENYWSDLRSEYDGIARTGRALQQAEHILFDARPVRDPVAILYSVSHDIWHTDDPASFVEMRLTWHALRHLGFQPDFLREEDVEAGRLSNYKVLYLCGQCLTRRASEAIDRWVREGGTVYLCAGAATRDEYFEPYVPPFAAGVWPVDAAARMVKEKHTYNERVDLPRIKPLAAARFDLDGRREEIRVLGCRLDLQSSGSVRRIASFDDGAPAAAVAQHGAGRVVAVGLLPGLAYSPFRVNQDTLDEKWPEGPRRVIGMATELAGVRPAVIADQPVVEASLLDGPAGSAVVLANYTYQPIERLRVVLRGRRVPPRAVSTEGVPVTIVQTPDGPAMELPLAWTDIVLLPRE